MLDSFVDAVVVYVVGGRLGSQPPVVANRWLWQNRARKDCGSPDWAGQDLRSPTATAVVLFGHFESEDRGDLLGLPDVPMQVQQPLGEFLHGCPAMQDEVVAILPSSTACDHALLHDSALVTGSHRLFNPAPTEAELAPDS